MGDIRKYPGKRIKPDDKRHRKQICFAMTAGEYESILETAGRYDTTMSRVIRTALDRFFELSEVEKRGALWD